MHKDDMGTEKKSLKRDIRTILEILPSISQNLLREALLTF